MNANSKITTSLLLFIAFWSTQCTSDQLPEPVVAEFCDTIDATYDGEIKPIIDASCAYSGCHDGSSGIPGNFSSFAGLQSVTSSGSFEQRVIDFRDNPVTGMPPNQSVYPQSLKDDLTADELEIIECWIRLGFPER